MCRQIYSIINTGRITALSVTALIFSLAGCATQQIISDQERSSLWGHHTQAIYMLDDWGLAGRIAVRNENEAFSASLYWQQTGGAFDIRIIAPMAQGTAVISGDNDSVVLRTTDDQEYSNDDVVAMMSEHLGWSVPIDALNYWTRGIPQPGHDTDDLMIDTYGRCTSFNQAGWKIEIQRYDLTTSVALPSRIQLSREGTQIRLVINRWEVRS